MSRTDRHRPWHVQEVDPHERRWYRTDGGDRWPWYRCCTCRTWYCSLTQHHRLDRRRHRHDGQRRLRDAVKGAWDALD